MFDKSKIAIKNEADRTARFLNLVIDYAVIQLVAFLLGVFGGIIFIFTGNTATFNAFTESRLWSYIVGAILFFIYYFLMEKYTGGRTIGKLITGTMVVTEAGNKPGTAACILRTLSRFVPFDAISFLSHSGKWHDTWTDTLVVKKKAFENDFQTLQSEYDIENLGKNNNL